MQRDHNELMPQRFSQQLVFRETVQAIDYDIPPLTQRGPDPLDSQPRDDLHPALSTHLLTHLTLGLWIQLKPTCVNLLDDESSEVNDFGIKPLGQKGGRY